MTDRQSLIPFVPCWLVPWRHTHWLTGKRRWEIGHRWDLAVHGPAGTTFICDRCGAST